MKIKYLENPKQIPLAYLTNTTKMFITTEDIEVELSDGRNVIIPKGFKTDLASSPRYTWSFFTPFDKALIGDIIHDFLWVDKLNEIKVHGGIFEARKFADDERLRWRNGIVKNLKLKNWISHKVIRLLGGLYYSNQLKLSEYQ